MNEPEVAEPVERTWIGHGKISPRIRKQYLALLEAVGPTHVEHYAEDFIEWGTHYRPPAELKTRWRLEAFDGDLGDQIEHARLVRRFRQLLRAHHEVFAWRAIEQQAKTNIKLSKQAATGELEAAKQVQLQYSGMNLAYTIKEVSGGFGTPQPTPTQRTRVKVKTVQKQAQLAEPAVIGEFRAG